MRPPTATEFDSTSLTNHVGLVFGETADVVVGAFFGALHFYAVSLEATTGRPGPNSPNRFIVLMNAPMPDLAGCVGDNP